MGAAVAVGLTLAVIWFIEKMTGTSMVARPIVVSSVIGILLGDVTTGVIIGASLELIFMGAIQIGGAVPPDPLFGSALGTAFAILTGEGIEVALALALPIAILAQSLKVVVFIVRSWFMSYAVKMAEKANIRGLIALNIGGLLMQCALYFVVGFTAISFGSAAVQVFVDNIPEVLMNGLKVSGGLLPAVGFALLLKPMMNKSNFLYFLMGFILVSYLQLPMLAITIIGVVLSFIVVFERADMQPATVQASADDELEGLFDE
ncbi:PTS sugar transporter subunit IIC [Proteiniclasticum sp. SCR006]|uniref:PTS sugar transporter subunit IIC n=1 Tax=Proteiniclasticum aestuarii TaxID=2817862 RepID=A0A939HBP1_9CLOT|nr:PTS sugar transporter subunit IIC [Proteiniclasticum aestuarii]MBO1265405.1 PTS sugar transporter subunit IIC [Proteiniclasticum aestuarii]